MQNPTFRRLLGGQVVVSFGGQVSALAVPTVAILALNAGPMEVGILAALPWLPSPLLGPIAGALIDRFPRRPVMVAADLGRCLCLLAMGAGLAFGHINLFQLYGIALVLGSLGLFFDVAYQAYLPSAFTDRELLQVNSRVDMAKSPALVAGAAVAGLLLSTVGPARSVVGAAITFLANAINLAGVRPAGPPVPETSVHRGLLREMGDGLVMVARNPILRSIATATAVSNLGVFMFSSVSLVFAYRSLHLSAGVIGLV
ncbi:MAG: MFS transporter, partial [Candidatus Dormibacteraeota bacterium]|nr:MFS transporter [Candidatus Dormibacteraeota bacterium]